MTYLILLRLSHSGERTRYGSALAGQEPLRANPDTRTAGLRELADLGVVQTRRKVVDDNVFDVRRLRSTYTLSPWAVGSLTTEPSPE